MGKGRRTVGEDGKVIRVTGDKMKYIIDVVENTLNREEADEYYAKSIVKIMRLNENHT